MAVATINSITTTVGNTEALSLNNTSFPLGSFSVGSCVIVMAATRHATTSYAELSGAGCYWNLVATYSFTAPQVQSIAIFVGRVKTAGGGTVTATGTSSLASINGSFGWQVLTTTGMALGTSWVVEATGSSNNTGNSTNITMPTLVPGGASRAYIGYGDAGGTATNTGITAGYTGTIENAGGLNQWISNLSVSTSQSPIGKQGTSTTSGAVGLLLYATNADTAVATNLNIGGGGGKNHFKLQTAFLGYTDDTELDQADIIAGWNTDPQFRANSDGSVTFSVAAGAPGTSPSTTYPRTELAEMSTDGVTDLAWNANVGIHWIRGRTRIGTLGPNRPHATLFQLHDGRGGFPSLVGEVIQISAQVDSGDHRLRLRLWDTTVNIPPLSASADNGDVMDWMCYINAGYWAFYYQDLGTPIYDSNNFAADGYTDTFTGNAEYYFKCGMYPQTNEASPAFEDPAAIQSADLMYLRHWHTGWPVADPVTLPKTAQFAPFFG